jgi:hypothetical protein
MIVCTSCGGQNPADAAFCGDCGAFLEWVGTNEEAAEEAAAPAPVDQEAVVNVPEAVLPGEAAHRRTRKAAPLVLPPAAGELACPHCGAGNQPGRRFCRACGAALAAAPPPARKERWWRRLLRRRKSYTAGTRRRIRRRVRVPRSLVALAVVAALGLLAAGPGRGVIDWTQQEVRDRLSPPAPVTPAGWQASSAVPDGDPDNLSDRVTNQFWAPEGDPAGAWAEAELPRPVRLLSLVITAGQSTEAELFQQQARPHELAVTAIAEDGTTVTAELVVRDQPGPQRFPIEADQVVRVRLEIRSAHGMEPDRFMAIGEIELFARDP